MHVALACAKGEHMKLQQDKCLLGCMQLKFLS
jgi:hypothetical protein